MTRLKNFILVVDIVVIIFLCIFLFLWTTDTVDLNFIFLIATRINTPLIRIIIGSVLAFIVSVNIFVLLCGDVFDVLRKPIIIKGEDFDISLHPTGIEETIAKAISNFEEVSEYEVKVFKDSLSPRPLKVLLTFSTYEGSNIKELFERLAVAIRLRLQEIVELKDGVDLEVRFAREIIKVEKKEKKKKEEVFKEEFRGPQYPIDY